jgi:hypothetical protein
MKHIYIILYAIVKLIVMTIAVVIELPVKIALTLASIALFIVMSFLTPLFNNVTCPDWWGNFTDYCVNYTNWILPEWVNKNYKI